jgi:hypothetical protein
VLPIKYQFILAKQFQIRRFLEIEINLPTGSPKGTSCSESKRRPLNGEKSMAMHKDKGKEQLKKAFYMVDLFIGVSF